MKSESRAVEAREVPGRFRGEPPCGRGRTALGTSLPSWPRGFDSRRPLQAPLAQWQSDRLLTCVRSGFKSQVAHHAGVKGTGIPRDFKPRGLRVRLAPSALIPGGLLASHQGPEPWPRWFDPSPGSFAAAHGCGPALVRRVTRVGTGWRLHVLVAQQAEALGRGPRGCGFESRLAHRARGSSDRADLVSPASRGWHSAGL